TATASTRRFPSSRYRCRACCTSASVVLPLLRPGNPDDQDEDRESDRHLEEDHPHCGDCTVGRRVRFGATAAMSVLPGLPRVPATTQACAGTGKLRADGVLGAPRLANREPAAELQGVRFGLSANRLGERAQENVRQRARRKSG